MSHEFYTKSNVYYANVYKRHFLFFNEKLVHKRFCLFLNIYYTYGSICVALSQTVC